MPTLECGDVRILNRVFKMFGYPDDTWYQDVKSKGYWAEFGLDHLVNLVASDDICLDLGANVGTMTLAMAALASRGHVYAFEASPDTCAALAETVKANQLPNVTVLNHVLGRANEKVSFVDLPKVRSSGFYVTADSTEGIATVQPASMQKIESVTKSVDQLMDELRIPKVDLIKIDVEGAELDVLEGARETLARFRPIVIMEFNSYAWVHIREIAPRKALQRILEIFDEVYFFKNRTGDLVLLENTHEAREKFLNDNLYNGFVDDLLCCFRGARLIRGDQPQFFSSSAVDSLRAELARKQQEIDTLHASTSWRVTAPLRALKRVITGR